MEQQEMCKKCHANIFSRKEHVSLFLKKPDWIYPARIGTIWLDVDKNQTFKLSSDCINSKMQN